MSIRIPVPGRTIAAIAAAAALVVSLAVALPSEAESSKVGLDGGRTALKLDKDAAAALESLHVSLEGVGAAKAVRGGLAFPITGGRVDAETLAGRIRHSGGIALSRGSTRVELTRFKIKVDGSPNLTAKVGGDRVSILTLDLSDLERKDRGDTVRLRGIEVLLTADAAAALNQAFGTDAFKEGLKLGTARVRAEV